MDFWLVLFDILILLGVALILGLAFERARQSAILGYLAAGVLLGPGAFNWISSQRVISQVAELGAALLLFSIGLEFSWRRLRSLGPVALGGGSLQIALTGALAAAAALALGLGWPAAAAVGAMLALSSTACVLRILTDRGELESLHGRGALGILLFQDMALVPLVLLVASLGAEGSPREIIFGIGRAEALALLLIAALYVAVNFILPRLLAAMAARGSRELLVLLATVTALGSAWAAHNLGLPPTLGAFVAGLLLAESPFALQIRADVAALRILFVTLFFASIGMVAELGAARTNWPGVAALAAAIVFGKALIVWPIVRAFGYPHRHALATGISLAQVGEFSFVLAHVAVAGAVISGGSFQVIILATLISLFLTPYLVAVAPGFAERVEQLIARTRAEMPGEEGRPEPGLRDHVIIVGLGPAGQGVMEALRSQGLPVVIVELNPRTVAAACDRGVPARVGDSTQAPVLRQLGVGSARAVVVTVPDYRTAAQTIRQVRGLAPKAFIIARARYNIFAGELERSGADVIVNEEREIGQRLGQEALRRVGGPA